MKKQIGINFNYGPNELNDQIFKISPKRMENRIRDAFSRVNVEVHTVDLVNPKSPETIAVIYFDFNWRHWLHDEFLKNVPYDKRVLVYVEPANVNPTAYYISFFRNHFKTIFTFDEILLAKNPSYIPHTILPFGELEDYPSNRYADIPFSNKKLLCSISSNRWHYMPQSNYGRRKRIYKWFCENHPDDFDLYGHSWNKPITRIERIFGHPVFKCYRGTIDGPYSRKMDTMARYKFALCVENCATRPGYISEKIRDCFCSRTIPIYYGASGIEKRVPSHCYINLREFRNCQALYDYLTAMTEAEYSSRVEAINQFILSPAAHYFSADNFTGILVDGIMSRLGSK